ncbi:hypothetical protein NCS52_00277700 [Fusarium sp. LHS14.1]|nr:hypothetical protein NCS52_00277700 [Fusarium sp. LHS14.1]
MITRNPGACAQCGRTKRRCDQRKPRCTRCVRRDVPCERQNFKPWKTMTGRERVKSGYELHDHGTTSAYSTTPSSRATEAPLPAETQSRLPSIDQLIRSATSAIWTEATGLQPAADDRSSPEIELPPTGTPTSPACHFSPHLEVEVSLESTALLAPSLSILPSALRARPQHMLLWHYFINTSSRFFRCWDNDSLTGKSIQWQDPLSATSDSLLPPLAAALLLFRIDDYSRSYLLSLAKSAVTCIKSIDPRRHQQDKRLDALTPLLAWTDICTSSSLGPLQSSHTVSSSLALNDYGEDGSPWQGFERWITHPAYAFSRRLISPLMEDGKANPNQEGSPDLDTRDGSRC